MDSELNTFLKVSMENLKDIIDVNTIVGEAIVLSDSAKVIPISKVRMGFISGGSDLHIPRDNNPFGGATGGTVFITPVAFLIIDNENIRVLHLQANTHLTEKIIEEFPSLSNKLIDLFKDIGKNQKI